VDEEGSGGVELRMRYSSWDSPHPQSKQTTLQRALTAARATLQI
jgi:hypothetical protein